MKLYSLAIALMCYVNFCIAQNSQIEILKNTITSTTDVKTKSELLINLLNNHIDPRNKDEQDQYIHWGEKLCTLDISNDINFECERVKLRLLDAQDKHNEYLVKAKNLLKQKYVQQAKTKVHFVNISISKAFRHLREADSVIKYVSQAQKYVTDYNEKAYVYDQLAEMHSIKGDFDTSIKFADSLLEITPLLNDPQFEYRGYFRLARNQRKMSFLKEAIGNYNRALEIKLKEDSISRIIGSLYLELSRTHKQLEDYPNAITYINKSFYVFNKLNRKRMLSQVHDEYSDYYIETENYDSSFYHLEKAMKIKNDLNITSDLRYSYSKLGRLYYLKSDKDFEKSLYYLHLSKELYQEKATLAQQASIEISLFNVYQLQKKTEQASEHLDKYFTLIDSLNRKRNREALAESEIKYKTFEKEKELQQQKIDIQNKQIIILIISLITSVLASILGFILLKRRQKRKTQEQLLKAFADGFDNYLIKKYHISKTELTLWQMFIDDATEKELADHFSKSVDTIKRWRKILYRKLNNIHEVEQNYTKVKASNLHKKEYEIFKSLQN